MAAESINPWIRAEQHLPSDETRALLEAREQEHYDFIIDEVARTGRELNEAIGMVAVRQTEHAAALAARDNYFHQRRAA